MMRDDLITIVTCWHCDHIVLASTNEEEIEIFTSLPYCPNCDAEDDGIWQCYLVTND